MQDIKTTVRSFVVDNFIMGNSAAALADGDSFMAGHVIDSTGFLELVGFLEDTFGITVADDEMVPENLDSLDNIAAYVKRKLPA
ncbi:MAG TPA: acyl carrier protein [Gemmatimonadaceae bacterium]|nr:acyl carrier protein [Gemmatimonadaceae bacterium]